MADGVCRCRHVSAMALAIPSCRREGDDAQRLWLCVWVPRKGYLRSQQGLRLKKTVARWTKALPREVRCQLVSDRAYSREANLKR